MAKEDEKLPFTRHVVSATKHFYIIENLIFIMLMRSEKVIISNPESQVIVGAVDVVKAVRVVVRSLVGRFSRSIICLNGRYSVETASSLVSPMTCVILKVNALPNFRTNSIAASG